MVFLCFAVVGVQTFEKTWGRETVCASWEVGKDTLEPPTHATLRLANVWSSWGMRAQGLQEGLR